MPDLSTTYLGLQLRNPLLAAASPLSKHVDTVRRLEDAGAAGVIMYSLFEEQITHESLALDHFLTRGTHSYAEALTYFPDLSTYNVGPQAYLEHIRRLKAAVDIPIIGSLNGISTGGWVEYAKLMEEAGADAVELNIYYLPTDADLTAAELEDTYVELVQAVRAQLTVPLAVKLSPFFTSLPNLVARLERAGANGVVLFNRFYQPDIDLETLTVQPKLVLSESSELRLPLRWIAILYGRVRLDLAASTGIHTPEDLVKVVMAGASAGTVASAFLRHGPEHAAKLLAGLSEWMLDHEYHSVRQMRGSMSQQAVAEPAAFERANYMQALVSLDAMFA